MVYLFYLFINMIYKVHHSQLNVKTCTNADFRSKVSSKFTLSLLVNNELYVTLWARPISLIYDVQHSKIYHVNCLFNPYLMKHSIFESDS